MKVKNIVELLTIICLCVLASCDKISNYELQSQYRDFQQSAMEKFIDKDYDGSISDFRQAFKRNPSKSENDKFYAAACALRLGKDDEAKEYIISAITNNNASETYYDNFDYFTEFRSSDILIEISENYSKYQKIYMSKLKNPEIAEQIDSMRELDQLVRTNRDQEYLMGAVDSSNIKRLIEITKEFGWQEKGWIILWHQRGYYKSGNEAWNFFYPYISSEIEIGNIDPDFWVGFEDEQSIRNDGVQIFGTYSNNYEQFPIKDIQNVDRLRDSVGLPSLRFMNKVYSMNLPTDYNYID
jgi:tetratricopeptide (TPR) repeat protein